MKAKHLCWCVHSTTLLGTGFFKILDLSVFNVSEYMRLEEPKLLFDVLEASASCSMPKLPSSERLYTNTP
jgi:hypothetical protein